MSASSKYVADVKACWAGINQQMEAGVVPVNTVRKPLMEYLFVVGVVLAANEVKVLIDAGHRDIVDTFRTTLGRRRLVNKLCARMQKRADETPALDPPLTMAIDSDLFFGFSTGVVFGVTEVIGHMDGLIPRKSRKQMNMYVDTVRQYSETLAVAAGYDRTAQ